MQETIIRYEVLYAPLKSVVSEVKNTTSNNLKQQEEAKESQNEANKQTISKTKRTNIVKAYQEQFNRRPNKTTFSVILDYLTDMDYEVVEWSFMIAHEKGKNFAYAKKQLEKWRKQGVKTMNDIN